MNTSSSSFTGFPPDALDLLARIGHNDRDWFTQHKQLYTADILEPTRALVADLAPELHDAVSPALQVVPKVNGSISPITNDARFHAVPPYKDYVLLRFWEGRDKASSSMLFMRISASGIGFGAGWRFAGSDVQRYRDAVAGPAGAELVNELATVRRTTGAAIIGDELKRVPAGYDPDHERADLLRRKQLGVTWQEPVPRSVTSARFVPWCSRRLVQAAGVHCWLRDHV